MKCNKWTLGLAALASAALTLTAAAQETQMKTADGATVVTTNTAEPPPTFSLDADKLLASLTTLSNYVVDVGYAHSVSGKANNLVFATVEYNFNNYAGALVGYDYLSGSGKHEVNGLRGGLTLQAPTTPFASLGYTNLVATPFVYDEVATPQNGNTIGNVLGGGLDFKLATVSKINLHAGIIYENRTGDGVFDGNYVGGYFAASTAF